MAQTFIRKQPVIVDTEAYTTWYVSQYPHHTPQLKAGDTHVVSSWHTEENERKNRVLVTNTEYTYEASVPLKFVKPVSEETSQPAAIE